MVFAERAEAAMDEAAGRLRAVDAGRALLIWLAGSAGLVLTARFAALLLPATAAGGLTAPLLYAVSLGIYLLMPAALAVTVARIGGWRPLLGGGLSTRGLLLVLPFFLVGMAGLVLVNLLVSGLIGSTDNPQIAALSGGQALSVGAIAALWLLLAVIVPICEELVFRGVVQPLIAQRWGAAAGIVLGGLIFAAAHLLPTLIPGLFVSGLLLGLLRQVSGSIWPGVIYHAMQNTLALAAFAAVLNGAA
jgi:uncharacterized protein